MPTFLCQCWRGKKGKQLVILLIVLNSGHIKDEFKIRYYLGVDLMQRKNENENKNSLT